MCATKMGKTTGMQVFRKHTWKSPAAARVLWPARRDTKPHQTYPTCCLQTIPESPHHQHQEWGVLSHLGSTSAAPTRAPASCQGLTARCLLLINRMSRGIISKAQFTDKWAGNSAACSGTALICFHKAQGHGQHPQQPPVQPYSRNDTAELHQRKFSLRERLSHSKVSRWRRELRLLNVT